MTDVNIMVWLAAGYGLVLLAAAWGIDLAARRAAQRTTAWHSGAFTYHEDHDAWLCPEDQWLWPQSFDPGNRVMRYRASPLVCNACPVKDTCTASNTGREISRNVDPWPSSEAERFHRGIACCVVVLAMLWPAITFFTARGALEHVMLAVVLVVVVLGSVPLWSHLRRSRPNFPLQVQVQDLDETVAQRQALAETVRQRRPVYGSDGDGARESPQPATPLPMPRVRYASDARSKPIGEYQPGFPLRGAGRTRSNS